MKSSTFGMFNCSYYHCLVCSGLLTSEAGRSHALEDGCFNAWLMDIKICISLGSARAQTLVAETTSS